MPPILKSTLQRPLARTTAKDPVTSFDRVKNMPIKEGKRGGMEVYQVFSVSGRLLGEASTRKAVEMMRDSYPLTTCLS